MHWQAFTFVNSVKSIFCDFFNESKVVEFGSSTVNYSIREIFADSKDYLGVDLAKGNNVNIVANAKDVYLGSDFTVAVSCECFEHNPFFLDTFMNMYRHVIDGGIVVFTCATTGRPEHGTRRTDPKESPGSQAIGWDYYHNVVADEFEDLQLNTLFSEYAFYVNDSSKDLYFVGIKNGSDLELSHEFASLEKAHESLTRLSNELNSLWEGEADLELIYECIVKVNKISNAIFTQHTFSSYIVKLIELIGENDTKLKTLVNTIHNIIVFNKNSVDCYRQLYLLNKAIQHKTDAYIYAERYFKESKSFLSLYLLTESLHHLKRSKRIIKLVLKNIDLVNYTASYLMRTQLLGYFISALTSNSKNVSFTPIEIVNNFICEQENQYLYKVFLAKAALSINDIKEAKLLYTEIDSSPVPTEYSWVISDIRKFKEIIKLGNLKSEN